VFRRRSFLRALIAFCAGVATRGWGQARSRDPSRIALVIGNNSYRKVALANAANDARAMQGVLADAGFEIDARIDAGADSMVSAVRDFGAAIARPEVKLAIFYYAGHGVQVDWRNYLVPIDANVTSRADLRRHTFDLGALLDVLPKSSDKAFVVILDACRDNPFGEALFTESKGLSQFDAPLSTLIAFSTSPGSVASDGTGHNGLYTENLARELRVGGVRIEDVFKRVRANVSLASRGLQIPWESTSLVSEVYVFPPPMPLTEEELERQFEEEVAQWRRVKGSRDPADWAALLRAFPNGKLSEIAQARLNALLSEAGPGAARGLEKRGPLVLGPGLPVPAFLARSDNPYSAGTYALDRRFTVGDEATYVGFEEGSEESRRFRRRVTKVDAGADRVELNGGRFATDLLGNLVKKDRVEYAVPVQVIPAQLQIGKRWTARFAAVRRKGEFDEDMSAQVVARESVKVPAGTFDAFRIEARIYGVQATGKRGKHAAFASQTDIVTWEVPGLNFAIKETRSVRRRAGTAEEKTFELESLRQKA
jgi:uncharacterized caspase-like protein